ncbi:alanyl-tRNA editing protein [SAR202 cluster bacterium AD-804-J14_MRT_500m]|nr:alanyl-tRNA editing protein [SAR202 cluster bacterium AD-804-J14_MRT_500m]
MTEALYHVDSYATEFDAVVDHVTDTGVVLNRTTFYPGGGGQPSDTGWLKINDFRYRVTRVIGRGGLTVHEIQDNDITSGDLVNGVIDWERRYQLMRTHTALHILCGVIWRDFGVQVTGGDMKPLEARMDFEMESMSSDFAEEVEKLINREVESERSVETRNLPRKEAFQIPDLIRTKINLLPEKINEVRIVDLVGLDLQADGGTHVANTREVGYIRVVGHESKGRINKRLRIALESADIG